MTSNRPRRRTLVAASVLTAGAAVGALGLATAAAAPFTAVAFAPQPTAPAARPEPTVTAARPEPTVTAARPEPTETAVAPEAYQGPSGGKVAPVPGTTFVRTELYFGTDRDPDPDVTDRQFARFVARQVTPRFPDGLTKLVGQGQFRSSDGTLVRERAFVLVLLYPPDDAEANTEIEDIRRLYKEAYDQESVLRADSRDRVSF